MIVVLENEIPWGLVGLVIGVLLGIISLSFFFIIILIASISI